MKIKHQFLLSQGLILQGLIQGSTDLGTQKLKYKPVLEKLQFIQDLWLEKYKNGYLTIYSNGVTDENPLIYEDVLAYVRIIDDMVATYSKYSSDKAIKAISMNGILTIAIILNSAYCFYSVNNRIKKPVYALLKEFRDMDLIGKDLAGDIGLSKKDEISIMASYIDELVYDSLTKVYNRRSGIPKLSKMLDGIDSINVTMSLCYVDIDGLKQVNDALGHKYGDDLILTVIGVIKRLIREDDFVIRLGGDEFLIVFKNADINVAKNIWNRISEAYCEINKSLEKPYIISVSHGIVCYDRKNKY